MYGRKSYLHGLFSFTQVTFGGLFRFAGIKMQVGPANESFVSTYRLSYSEEGLIWKEYMENGQQRVCKFKLMYCQCLKPTIHI